jgi:hypothetical protein
MPGPQSFLVRTNPNSISTVQLKATPVMKLLMVETKSTTLTVRAHPGVKEGLWAVVEKEHRYLANMIEVQILDNCAKCGITVWGYNR